MASIDNPTAFRKQLLLEIKESERGSTVRPWVAFRSLPSAKTCSADDILDQLDILESEGQVQLKKLEGSMGVADCVVRLTGIGRKSLEVDDDARNMGTSQTGDWGEGTSLGRKHEYEASQSTEPGSISEPHQPKAFVSHSTQDHAFVERFAADLRTNGVAAWFSKWEIKPGDSIRARIDEGLEGCEFFIIVLSKSSIGRPWVQTELDAATVRKLAGKVRKIIPVKIENCGELPPTLASLCWEDFSNQPYEAALKRVLESIFDVDVRPALGKPPIGSVSKREVTTAQYPEILSADWGIGEPDYKDKRELLVGYLEARTPELRASNRYFRDEYPNEPKHLRVRYRWSGSTQIRTRTFTENEIITFN